MKNKKAICTVSGGLDSTVSAAIAKSQGYKLYFLFFRYGQKTSKREEASVRKITEFYKPEKLLVIDLPWIKRMGGSALLDKKITLDEKNFRKEYVPFRNSIFWAAATAWAEVIGAERILIGSTGGDHICPDNSPKFISAFQEIMKIGTMLKKDIKLTAPLAKTDKKGAIKIGMKLKAPFHLTWSCHNNDKLACGHCSNCKSRLEAFGSLKLKDPIKYEKE
jgi:7-cyano-7-deazaguanine synthase